MTSPSRPLVSAVMPVYNGERFVADAISSLLSQSFGDFELIAVDDGSSDRSPDILAAFAEKDPRVRVHRMPVNVGAIAARNKGLELACGDYVAVMDADDVSLPNRFEHQVRHLNAHSETGVVGAYVRVIDDQGRPGTVRRYPTDPALLRWSMLFLNPLAHPVVMARRRVLLAAGGYAMGCKGGAEDYELFARLSVSTRIATIPEVLLYYRVWGSNMTSRSWTLQEQDARRIAREAAARLSGLEISDEDATYLRGLSTGSYPKSARACRSVGELIRHLCEAFIRQGSLAESDRRRVRADAGVKVWLLSAVAVKYSLSTSASLAALATTISPSAFPRFVAKVIKRASGR